MVQELLCRCLLLFFIGVPDIGLYENGSGISSTIHLPQLFNSVQMTEKRVDSERKLSRKESLDISWGAFIDIIYEMYL